jgi:hypothetical protein
MFGLNQAECCAGDTAGQCPVPTAEVAARDDRPGEKPSR